MVSFGIKYYLSAEILGSGGFGVVYSGLRRCDSLPVAIKFVNRDKIVEWQIYDNRVIPLEIYLMLKLTHVYGVAHILDYYEIREFFVIVTEKYDVNLHHYITETDSLDEKLAQYFFFQIANATRECFLAGVFHRDIKTTNVVLDLQNWEVKLIDFGCGDLVKNTYYTEIIGTELCFPPECFIQNSYLAQSFTVWNLGVLLYSMVFGTVPFPSKNEIITCEQIQFPRDVSPEFQDMIKKCLAFEPANRLSLDGLLDHPWMLL